MGWLVWAVDTLGEDRIPWVLIAFIGEADAAVTGHAVAVSLHCHHSSHSFGAHARRNRARLQPVLALLVDSIDLVKRSSDETLDWRNRLARASILSTCLLVEAAANCCVDSLPHHAKFRESIDKLQPLAKLETFLASPARDQLLIAAITASKKSMSYGSCVTPLYIPSGRSKKLGN